MAPTTGTTHDVVRVKTNPDDDGPVLVVRYGDGGILHVDAQDDAPPGMLELATAMAEHYNREIPPRRMGLRLGTADHDAVIRLAAPHLRPADLSEQAAAAAGLTDQDIWESSTPRAIVEALWAAGVLTLPGHRPQAPLSSPPARLEPPERVEARVAELLEPYLRHSTMASDDQPPSQVLAAAPTADVIAGLYDAGVLTLDRTSDRAALRSSWSALICALEFLHRREHIPLEVLTAIPEDLQLYLLGHQALHVATRDASARLSAARNLVGVMIDLGYEDLGYLRATLSVLQDLLAGRLAADMVPEPREGTFVDRSDEYSVVRHRAARVADHSEGIFNELTDAIALAGSSPAGAADRQRAHLLAHRAALYAWSTAALLRLILERLGVAAAGEAANVIEELGRNGDGPYLDDLPYPPAGAELADAAAGDPAAQDDTAAPAAAEESSS